MKNKEAAKNPKNKRKRQKSKSKHERGRIKAREKENPPRGFSLDDKGRGPFLLPFIYNIKNKKRNNPPEELGGRFELMEILEQGGEYIRQIRQKVRSGELKKTEGARLIFKKATN